MRWAELFEGKRYALSDAEVWIDPSRQQLKNLVSNVALRGLITPNHFIVWSAFDDVHENVRTDLIQNGFMTPEEAYHGQKVCLDHKGSDFGAFDYWEGDPTIINGIAILSDGALEHNAAFNRALGPVRAMVESSRVYHGTDASFRKFDDKFRGSSHGNTPTNRAGFHFSDSPDVAKTFGKNLLHCDVKLERPYVVDAKGQSYSEFKHDLNDILHKIDRSKYDGIILKNYLDAGKHGGDEYLLSNHYIPFYSRQIKVLPESFTDKVTSNIKAKTKIDKVTPQRGRSMPGSDPEKKLTRRKRFM